MPFLFEAQFAAAGFINGPGYLQTESSGHVKKHSAVLCHARQRRQGGLGPEANTETAMTVTGPPTVTLITSQFQITQPHTL